IRPIERRDETFAGMALRHVAHDAFGLRRFESFRDFCRQREQIALDEFEEILMIAARGADEGRTAVGAIKLTARHGRRQGPAVAAGRTTKLRRRIHAALSPWRLCLTRFLRNLREQL